MSYEIISPPYLNGAADKCVEIEVMDTLGLSVTLEMKRVGETITGITGLLISFPGAVVELEIQDAELNGKPLSEEVRRLYWDQILDMTK